jgi:isopenicillin N synthase-like dioxygenase
MELPIFDISGFLTDPDAERVREQCKQMSDCMHQSGVLIIRDPRVSKEDNERFLDVMERYFEQPAEVKKEDERPDLHYQVGVTPECTELSRCSQQPECLERIAQMPEEDKAHSPQGPDLKERFFWRIGERPTKTDFPALNAAPVIPRNFPEWAEVMNGWGNKLLTAVTTVAEMVALGLGLEQKAFSDLMQYAPHLLAPTGTNLAKYGTLGAIYAGFHYDLSFLTIHGKSRFPGLFIWLRNGKKMLVRVPEGCLLVQGGKQLEILTGGYIEAGYHEVVCVKETLEAIERAKAAGRSLWRISSTLFGHIASDNVLQPLGIYGQSEEVRQKYPAIKAGHQVQAELEVIKLGKKASVSTSE